MQRGSYNPILVYKPVGSALTNNPLIKKQDFILCIMTEAQLELLEIYGKNIMMMDSTHGTNQYGYLLTTVMVCDDNHEGLPVAICYYNRALYLNLYSQKFLCQMMILLFGMLGKEYLEMLNTTCYAVSMHHEAGIGILVLKKEREAILREKEKSVVCWERAELVYERIRRRMQFINTAASVTSTEEIKRLNQCLEDLKHMGYSEFGSSLRSIENFPANRYIIKQRQKKNSRPLNKQKLANVM
ncbi:uncharacterized protein TNCV_1214381 [Trichonephila clavipes]|nr:uncharacterized protein TNCV_1214381 [Trichonephila clavipes]